jgi:hypothetical protein
MPMLTFDESNSPKLEKVSTEAGFGAEAVGDGAALLEHATSPSAAAADPINMPPTMHERFILMVSSLSLGDGRVSHPR